MDNWEFEAWWTFYWKVEPFGEMRADLRNGMLASPLVNLLRCMALKDPKMGNPSEWLFEMKGSDEQVVQPQDWRAMQAALRAYSKAFGTVAPAKKKKKV